MLWLSKGPSPQITVYVVSRGGAGVDVYVLQVETRHGRELTSHYAGWIESDFSKWNVSLIGKVRSVLSPRPLASCTF